MVLKRDVPMLSFYVIALVLLALPPVFVALRAVTMERARWKASDYASTDSGPTSGDAD
jgi:hypothetical protein